METQSQNKRIRQYLETGKKLTALTALYEFGTMRLSARIYDLKDEGMNIESEIIEITSPSVLSGKKKVAQYRLVK